MRVGPADEACRPIHRIMEDAPAKGLADQNGIGKPLPNLVLIFGDEYDRDGLIGADDAHGGDAGPLRKTLVGRDQIGAPLFGRRRSASSSQSTISKLVYPSSRSDIFDKRRHQELVLDYQGVHAKSPATQSGLAARRGGEY